ncbi:hypothetical protein AK812_SmicGene46930, partial [Symbiodinium microadriaticum]
AKGSADMANMVYKIGAGSRQLDMLYKIAAAGQSAPNVHTYCTRFLYTVLPAELYWNDATLDALNDALASDLISLFRTGITAPRWDTDTLLNADYCRYLQGYVFGNRCGKDFVVSGLLLLCKLKLDYMKNFEPSYAIPTGEECPDHLFEMLLYVVKCANVYFRILHYEGLPRDDRYMADY